MPSETSAVNAAYIEARMKQFKLVDMREQYQELIRVASEQSMTYEDFLIMLLQAEETGKKRRQAERLTDAANFDSDKRLSDIDYRFNPNGSVDAIEGITSPDGRVFGKMGHSERYTGSLYLNVDGNKDQKMFAGAVDYFRD